MFLVNVRAPNFNRTMPTLDARDTLRTLWAFANQNFQMIVLDERGREVSMLQLEIMAADDGRLGPQTTGAPDTEH